MELTGLQIFKELPAGQKGEHSNCKKCSCPTCMAFALKLAKQAVSPDACPYFPKELKEKYMQYIKIPQKTVTIGDLKIGGENVLFRHEKTFINPTVFTVVVDCLNPKYKALLNRICNFKIKGVNKDLKIDLIIVKNKTSDFDNICTIPFITDTDYRKLEIDNITDTNFETTKNYLINTRTKAIREKDENYSRPVCVKIPSGNEYEICARASYYICKCANMLIFENFSEEVFSTILRLRENIYTDPQRPMQVESGIYEFNNPNKNSIVFLTTNFSLTYFAVANELEGAKVPTYLIVIPTDGMSVLTAWSAEKFTAQIVANTLEKLNVRNKINTRKIIIPGLLAHTIEELHHTVPDFEFVIGTNEASDLREFIKNYKG